MAGVELELSDQAATEAFGARLAACYTGDRLLVFLHGELGAGKTTLVRGFLRALGHAGAVKSPTYTLVESYSVTGVSVHHLDLYRLADSEELEWLGIRDLLAPDTICLIEWPQRGAGFLPVADLQLTLIHQGDSRRLRLEAGSETGDKLLSCLKI
jgi:tRNA threonylcarbamoyladenosine biosynthesis protein TsaE